MVFAAATIAKNTPSNDLTSTSGFNFTASAPGAVNSGSTFSINGILAGSAFGTGVVSALSNPLDGLGGLASHSGLAGYLPLSGGTLSGGLTVQPIGSYLDNAIFVGNLTGGYASLSWLDKYATTSNGFAAMGLIGDSTIGGVYSSTFAIASSWPGIGPSSAYSDVQNEYDLALGDDIGGGFFHRQIELIYNDPGTIKTNATTTTGSSAMTITGSTSGIVSPGRIYGPGVAVGTTYTASGTSVTLSATATSSNTNQGYVFSPATSNPPRTGYLRGWAPAANKGPVALKWLPSTGQVAVGGISSSADPAVTGSSALSTPSLAIGGFTFAPGANFAGTVMGTTTPLTASQMPALTGDVTSSAGTVATTITANAVTNAKLATMAANTIKANATGSTATPTDVATGTGVMTALGNAVTGSGGIVLGTSPILVTPFLSTGTYSMTLVNGVSAGEVDFSSSSAANVFTVTNTTNTAFSAINFTDLNKKEKTAYGYGNPGAIAPFAGWSYNETSDASNATSGLAPGYEIVQSSTFGSLSYNFIPRTRYQQNGEIDFYPITDGFSVNPFITMPPNGGVSINGPTSGTSRVNIGTNGAMTQVLPSSTSGAGTIAASGTTITGTGTSFTTSCQVGSLITTSGGYAAAVAVINSNTSLTVWVSNGTVSSGTAYFICAPAYSMTGTFSGFQDFIDPYGELILSSGRNDLIIANKANTTTAWTIADDSSGNFTLGNPSGNGTVLQLDPGAPANSIHVTSSLTDLSAQSVKTNVASGMVKSSSGTLTSASAGIDYQSAITTTWGNTGFGNDDSESYALTATPTSISSGEDATSAITLGAASGQVWRLDAQCQIDLSGATFASNRIVTIKIRRTNNTATDILTKTYTVPTTTTLTETLGVFVLPPIYYTTTASGDVLDIFGSISVVPTVGSINVTDWGFTSVRIK